MSLAIVWSMLAISIVTKATHETVVSQLQVWRDGQLQTYIYPGRTVYRTFDNQPVSLIPITTFGLTDLYVYLDDWNGASQATINVFVNPSGAACLVRWPGYATRWNTLLVAFQTTC